MKRVSYIATHYAVFSSISQLPLRSKYSPKYSLFKYPKSLFLP